MKKLPGSLNLHLAPLALDVDDVAALWNAMRQYDDKIELEAAGHGLEGPEELPKLPADVVTDLTLRCSKPFVRVELDRHDAYLSAAHDDPMSRALFEQLKAILLPRQRRTRLLTHYWILPFGLSYSSVLPVLAGGSFWFAVAAFAGFLAWLGCALWNALERHSVVVLKHRRDRPSFLQRNSDNIIVALISAVLGIVLTLLVQRLHIM